MKKKQLQNQYFFVDEAGDSIFYNKRGRLIVGEEGCSKILLLGFIKTENPEALRTTVAGLRLGIINDPYLQKIPSLAKTRLAFHATDDCPEVREKVFKCIVNLNFTAEFIVALKIEPLFRKRHRAKESLFYDDLITKLFENKLHLAEKNYIYFSVRGSRTRQEPLEDAIQLAVNTFEKKWNTKVDSDIHILPQSPLGEPCLQVADYMNWTVQRLFQKGDDRYFKFVEEKISYLVDVYDFEKYPNNFYSRRNKFDINKMSPL